MDITYIEAKANLAKAQKALLSALRKHGAVSLKFEQARLKFQQAQEAFDKSKEVK